MSKVLLVILDGFGIGKPDKDNAIYMAKTPYIDSLKQQNTMATLKCCGRDVGLMDGQMGNSEVGHLNLGAGRVVSQKLLEITEQIAGDTFDKNPELLAACRHCVPQLSTLHLVGLLSDGGVHSHISHLEALLLLAQQTGVGKIAIHAFLDGRDVAPRCGEKYVERLEKFITQHQIPAQIATIGGRYYGMDRDNRWERVEKAYRAICDQQGESAPTASSAIAQAYARGESDEFVRPTIIEPLPVRDGDSFIYFNFRPDRARQLTQAFCDPNFQGFGNLHRFVNLNFTTFTSYGAAFTQPVAFASTPMSGLLGEAISLANLRQLRIAETEKYAHVTYFFNGGNEDPLPREDRVLIPSPQVDTYDLQPCMSAPAVTEALIGKLEQEEYSLVVLNYANCDMVGHTGIFEAAACAIEAVDRCLAQLLPVATNQGFHVLVTADHGNADLMRDPVSGTPHTAHTTNDVPLIYIPAPKASQLELTPGRLADIAPTILHLLQLEQPEQMTGHCLLQDPDTEKSRC